MTFCPYMEVWCDEADGFPTSCSVMSGSNLPKHPNPPKSDHSASSVSAASGCTRTVFLSQRALTPKSHTLFETLLQICVPVRVFYDDAFASRKHTCCSVLAALLHGSLFFLKQRSHKSSKGGSPGFARTPGIVAIACIAIFLVVAHFCMQGGAASL
jgi:hypothetical protein